jgi:hypothetical protein
MARYRQYTKIYQSRGYESTSLPRPFDSVFTVIENLFPVFAILYGRTPNFSAGSINYNLYNKKYQGLRGKKTMSWGGKAPE